MKKMSLALALAAGAACTASAFAQESDVLNMPSIRKEAPRQAYGSRVNQLVYAVGLVPGAIWAGNGGAERSGDEISLIPGPGSGGNITINAAYFSTLMGAGDTNSNSETVGLVFYDTFGGWTDLTFPGTTLLGSLLFDLADFNTPGFITFYDVPIAPNAAATVTIPDANALVVQEVYNYQTTTMHPSIGPVFRGTNTAVDIDSVTVGDSDTRRWIDTNGDNVIQAAAEINTGALSAYRFLYMGFQGDAPPPTAPPSTDLGAISDTQAQTCGNLADATVAWYRLTLANPATDANLTFFEVDSEGSTADVSIGMYDELGNLVGFQGQDADDGSGTNAQLTYGVGRRAPSGDGRAYDGRDGEVTNAVSNIYYLAVTPNTGSFGPSFTVGAGAGTGGAYCLNFKTNVNGTALAPSIPPTEVTSLGQIFPPGAPGGATAPREEASWYSFEIVDMGCGASTPTFDFDFSRTVTPADSESFIFDSNGNQIVTEDDADADGVTPFYVQPQFSFGATSPVRPPFNALAENFSGQDGALANGVYYMANALFDVGSLAAATTDGRWHVRATSGSSLDINFDIYASCISGCGSADFDGDGDTGTDLDIEAFFACLGGNCCATCGSADFDGDGDTGTDLDIEAFFRVLGGGTC
jgi:hypothetical protein